MTIIIIMSICVVVNLVCCGIQYALGNRRLVVLGLLGAVVCALVLIDKFLEVLT